MGGQHGGRRERFEFFCGRIRIRRVLVRVLVRVLIRVLRVDHTDADGRTAAPSGRVSDESRTLVEAGSGGRGLELEEKEPR